MVEAVPYEYLVSSGVIVPDTSEILSDVEGEYQAVFGADLIVTPDTPQGVLINAEALARAQVVNNNAALANQINPNLSGGVFLDAVMALTGIERDNQTQTFVPLVTIAGVAGTVIAQGSQAQTQAGDIFATLSTVTLNAQGQAQVNFASLAYGPIPCAIGALSLVVSNILGWETVTNPIAGTLGTTTQSDQGGRAYRNNTLAFQGVALALAQTSALYATQGVTSLTYRENFESYAQTIDGIYLKANSVYACVQGGTDTDVAAALLENKSQGAGWNGSTTINLVEPSSGQTYPVQFDRPTEIPILINVTSPNGNAAAISQSIIDYMNGNIEGLAGFVVGADVSPFEIAGAIMSENPGFFVTSVTISNIAPVNFQPIPIAIGLNQQAYTQPSYINVTVG